MGIDFSKRPSGTSRREYAAQKLGGSKEDYSSSGQPKSSSSSSKKSSKSSSGSSSSSSSSYSAPKVDDSQLKALQGKYTESLAPTQQESDTQTQLDNIITSKELGIQGIEQKPIASVFKPGKYASLEKSASLKSLPLKTRLADLQSRRQSAADVLKAQLGFETSNVNRQTSSAESALDRTYRQEQSDISQSQYQQNFEEGQRQFNASEGRLSSKTDEPTDDDNFKEGKEGITSFLEGLKGSDGYVSPTDYNRAKAQWATNRFSTASFDAIFSKYKNPSDIKKKLF